MPNTAVQREARHAAATEAWLDAKRKKKGFPQHRVSGLAEKVRAEANSHARARRHDRAAKLAAHLARLRKMRETNVLPYRAPAHRGSYFPHQGPRECARRVRQLAG